MSLVSRGHKLLGYGKQSELGFQGLLTQVLTLFGKKTEKNTLLPHSWLINTSALQASKRLETQSDYVCRISEKKIVGKLFCFSKIHGRIECRIRRGEWLLSVCEKDGAAMRHLPHTVNGYTYVLFPAK